jgi:hypothetical protein
MITYEMLEEARLLAIQLKELKAKEMNLRKEIAFDLGDGLDPGTHTIVRDGFQIKLKLGVSYTLVQDELIELMEMNALTDEELGLIRTKYDLKLAEYKKAGYTETLDEVIIVKPSAPTLEITLGE